MLLLPNVTPVSWSPTWRRAWFALVGALLALPAEASAQTPAVPTPAARVQQLAAAGEAGTARTYADSVLRALSPDDDMFPEVLFARASVATTAADAERDYLRVSVEHPRSPRAAEALLRLAQLELARGDRAGARRHLERLLREYPDGTLIPRAAFWSARMAFEDGHAVRGCEALAIARQRVPSVEVELSNQIEYLQPRCTNAALSMVVDSSGVDHVDASASGGGRPRRGASEDSSAATSRERGAGTAFSVQVAAYAALRDASALAKRLKGRGFDVRVYGTTKPYRVRLGRYPTRADADAARLRVKRSGFSGIVVEAERR